MAIDPTERTQNIKASLYTNLQSNFTTAPIHLGGQPFDEQNKNEWVRADMLIESMDYYRQVGGGQFGGDLIVLFSINVFVKADDVLIKNGYRGEQLVDELKHLFRLPVAVPVHNHFAGSPLALIGYLRTAEIEDNDLGYDNDAAVFQHNVSSTMFFLSRWDAQA
jgi:hypothetical protein